MEESIFGYISDKIASAKFIDSPFPHLEINDFLSESHLGTILMDGQIHFPRCNSAESLVSKLLTETYKPQSFPGCVTDIDAYLKILRNDTTRKSVMEPLGITFRLSTYKNPFVESLMGYINGDSFHSALRKKFNIQQKTSLYSGIHKYLTKYEISPHPDIRAKAMTFLLNINKPEAEQYDIHTHLLRFKKEHEYMYDKWITETKSDRGWVPWEWCETIKTISRNNTMVIFSPSHESLHAVRLDYPHLDFQRTQIYGNMNYA